ncbi:unnamed protein product, partial [Chrysoparadoxa australica]
QSVNGASIRCDFTIRSNRYSGNEYVIAGADMADCPRFDRSDMYLDVTVDQADAADIRMRRFVFSSNGSISDADFDPSGVSGQILSGGSGARVMAVTGQTGHFQVLTQAQDALTSPQATAQAEFGPFEWTYDASGALRSEFRLSPVPAGELISVNISIANASKPGYQGNFDDCALTVRDAQRS